MGIGNRISQDDPKPLAQAADVGKYATQQPQFTFDELILPKPTLDQIVKALAFKKHHDLVFNTWGLSKTHKFSDRVCINFYGPPGTGKTMAAHAVAHYLEKSLLPVSYAEIESKYVGDTPKNLVSLFKEAEKMDAIIFFDEADALLSRRVSNMSNSTDTSVNQTRSVLLTLLNSYKGTVLFATNFIENFDPAFMRRILAHVKFELPDYESRKRLFEYYIPPEMPHLLTTELLAEKYDGLSGSDISNSILMAAFSAAERHSQIVEESDLICALTSILDGKKANSGNAGKVTIERREVSDEYVNSVLEKK